jgi:hypothetical protein
MSMPERGTQPDTPDGDAAALRAAELLRGLGYEVVVFDIRLLGEPHAKGCVCLPCLRRENDLVAGTGARGGGR